MSGCQIKRPERFPRGGIMWVWLAAVVDVPDGDEGPGFMWLWTPTRSDAWVFEDEECAGLVLRLMEDTAAGARIVPTKGAVQ